MSHKLESRDNLRFGSTDVLKGTKQLTIICNDNDRPHILIESESDYHPDNESESGTKELALLLMISS